MDWALILTIFFAALVVIFLTGIPVAFSFILVTLGAMYTVIGPNAPAMFINSIYDTLTNFSLTPIPLFILMGGLLFESGLANRALSALELWLGRVPGRLSVLTLVGGAVFASLSGSALANTAMLGSMLIPPMEERKYHPVMMVGPIMASGSLAMMIPPSTLMVIYGSLAGVSVGELLLAGVLPGFLLAGLFIFYTVGLAWRKPAYAPYDQVEAVPLIERLMVLARDVLPLAIVFLLTVGSIFLGLATPTEAAALGAFGSLLLVAAYGRLRLSVLRTSLEEAVKTSAMILMIVAGSTGFSQVLAFTGASRGLLQSILDLPVSPGLILFGMLAVVFILGMFMEEIAIMMITIPIYMPVVRALGINPLWFAILMLVVLQISLITPPVGMLLYIAKGVTPPRITMRDIWRGGTPYVVAGLVGLGLIAAFPGLAMFLPRFMAR